MKKEVKMNFFKKQMEFKPQREKSTKCKIVVRKKPDGSITKSIQGECSAQQLKALSEMKDIEETE